MEPADSRLDAFSEHFVRIVHQAMLAALYAVVLYPGLASILYMVQAIDSALTGRPMPTLDFLDAGGKQPVSTLLLRMGCTLTILSWLLQRRHVRAHTRPGTFLGLGLMAALLVSTALSQVKGDAAPAALTMLFALGLYHVGLEQFGDALLRRNLMLLFALSAALASWSALGLYLQVRTEEQLTGVFFQPNVLAGYVAMAIPVTLALWVEGESRLWRGLLFAFAVGDAAALLLTISRAGWGTMAVCVVLFGVAMARLDVLRRFGLGLLGWAVLAWFVFAGVGSLVSSDHRFHWVPPLAVTRAQNSRLEDVDSGRARVAFFRAALAIWREHPLWGVGLDSFNRYYPQHQDDFRWYSRYSHSMYLDWLAEGGIFALALFLGLVGWTLVRGLRARPGLLQTGMLLGILATLLHASVDVDFKFPSIPITFFLLCALCVAEPEAEDDTEPLGPGVYQLLGAMGLLLAFFFSFRLYMADAQTELGGALLKANKTDAAFKELLIGYQAFPWQAEACESLADATVHRWETTQDASLLEAAAHWAETATHVDPHRSVAWSRVAEVARLRGNPTLEQSAYETAVSLDPINFPSYYDNLALLAVDAHDETRALGLWKRATEPYPWSLVLETKPFRQDALRPQLVDAWRHLADFLATHDQVPASVEAYQHVLEMEPHNALAQFGLASTYVQLHRPADAVPCLLDVIGSTPKNAGAHVLLGSCYEQMKQLDKAKAEFEEALKLDPALKRQVDQARGQRSL